LTDLSAGMLQRHRSIWPCLPESLRAIGIHAPTAVLWHVSPQKTGSR
jgi:hypothetical protein